VTVADTERQAPEETLGSAARRPWVQVVTLVVLAVFLLSILVGAFLL
jgi:amino acid permease